MGGGYRRDRPSNDDCCPFAVMTSALHAGLAAEIGFVVSMCVLFL